MHMLHLETKNVAAPEPGPASRVPTANNFDNLDSDSQPDEGEDIYMPKRRQIYPPEDSEEKDSDSDGIGMSIPITIIELSHHTHLDLHMLDVNVINPIAQKEVPRPTFIAAAAPTTATGAGPADAALRKRATCKTALSKSLVPGPSVDEEMATQEVPAPARRGRGRGRGSRRP